MTKTTLELITPLPWPEGAKFAFVEDIKGDSYPLTYSVDEPKYNEHYEQFEATQEVSRALIPNNEYTSDMHTGFVTHGQWLAAQSKPKLPNAREVILAVPVWPEGYQHAVVSHVRTGTWSVCFSIEPPVLHFFGKAGKIHIYSWTFPDAPYHYGPVRKCEQWQGTIVTHEEWLASARRLPAETEVQSFYDRSLGEPWSDTASPEPTQANDLSLTLIAEGPKEDVEKFFREQSIKKTQADYRELQAQHDQLQTQLFNESRKVVTLKAELATAHSMHVDAVRFIWEQRGFGSCAEMAEHFDAVYTQLNNLRIAATCPEGMSDSKRLEKIRELAIASPQHHQATHDAEVAKAAFVAGAFWESNQFSDGEKDTEAEADQYAAQLRAKAGA